MKRLLVALVALGAFCLVIAVMAKANIGRAFLIGVPFGLAAYFRASANMATSGAAARQRRAAREYYRSIGR